MKNNSSLVAPSGTPRWRFGAGRSVRNPALALWGWSLIFFGDDDYSLTVLKHLLNFRGTSPKVATVVTRPPKPMGRKQILTPSPIELFARKQNIPFIHYQPQNIQHTVYNIQNTLTPNSLGVLASFGYILPKSILNLFPHGIINIHPSLLPQYRGATPVQHAIALGDKETGVTLFKLTPEIDKGEILAQETEPVLPTDTTPTLTHRLFKKGSQLFINFLQNPKLYSSLPKTKNLIYTRRFTRQTGFVPWGNFYAMMENQPLLVKNLQNPLLKLRAKIEKCKMTNENWLKDLARALNPWPGVWTIAPTTKGPLRLKLETKPIAWWSLRQEPRAGALGLVAKLAGKPKPISWNDFKKYYLPHTVK